MELASLLIAIWIIGAGIVSFLFKERMSKAVLKTNLHPAVGYYILVIPIILLEEIIAFRGFSFVAETILLYCILFAFLYLIQRWFLFDWKKSVFLFGSFMWLILFIIRGAIYTKTPFEIFAITIMIFAYYSVLATIPAYYLGESYKKKR